MDLRHPPRTRLRPQPSTHGTLAASGVVRCLRHLLRPPLQLGAVRSGVLELLDAYHTELAGHCDRTARLVRTLAYQLGCPPGDVPELEMAALLHDLGKVLLPRELLDEARLFSRLQIRAVHAHPRQGAGLLLATGRSLPASFLDAVAHHHERWDGAGYPAGLLRHEIPFAARLVAVADAYDAMTSPRPYRRLLTTREARIELLSGAGSQFDPTLVLAVLAHSLDVPFPGRAS